MKKYLYAFCSVVTAVLCGCSSDPDQAAGLPVIRIGPDRIVAVQEGGACRIDYTLENADPEACVAAVCAADWLRDFDVSEPGAVLFRADANRDEQPRTAVVELSYKGAATVKVTVWQGASEPEPLFRITCSDPRTSGADVEWVPSDGVGSYFSLVTEKAYYDRFSDDEAYIADDMEYISERARLYEVSFEEMLATYLTSGPKNSRIEGLKSDTEYYAYAYGMTPDGTPTTAIFKTLFKTLPVGDVDCTFAFEVTDLTAFGARVAVLPSNKQCTYFWDCVPRKTFEAFGTPDEVIATNIDYIHRAVEIWQMAGYDYTFSYFLTTGDDTDEQSELSPDTEYVLFAFGLDESGVATTPLAIHSFRTESFVASDDCTFTIGFEQVASTRFHVLVRPSNPSTRYYVGIGSAIQLDRYTPDELAGKFIEEENRNGIDWGGDRYIFTGERSLDTSADLELADLAPDTEYVAVVFGIDSEGNRTTVVAHDVCRTERVAQSAMTIDITVTNITSLGAYVTFRPSVDNETYFTDCIDYETYASFGGDDDAFVRAQVATLGTNIGAYLTVGYHPLDAEGFLKPETSYLAYAFGYSEGVTTPLMKSQVFTTKALETGGEAEVAVVTEVQDGDEYYAEDPVKYASYRGKAVVFARLTPNAHAVHWYAGAFKDISEYDDRTMISMLKAQGRQDAAQLGNLAEWGSQLTYAVVATDTQGVFGPLIRKIVRAERSSVTHAAVEATAVLPVLEAPQPVLRKADAAKPQGFDIRRPLRDFADAEPGCGMRLRTPRKLACRERAVRFQ